MELKEVKKFIGLARKSGIQVFKLGDLEFAFSPTLSAPARKTARVVSPPSTDIPIKQEPKPLTLEEINAYIYKDDEE